MTIIVYQPANIGGTYISAHAQYLSAPNIWSVVPTQDSEIGRRYRSTNFGGVRDFVDIPSSAQPTATNVALFMPYRAFNMIPNRKYQFRYVVRLWNENDEEIGNLVLDSLEVDVRPAQRGTITISITQAKACSRIMGGPENTPQQELKPAGAVTFFNTQTGKWECPNVDAPGP